MAPKKKKKGKQPTQEESKETQEESKEKCKHCNKDVEEEEAEALGCEICDRWSCIQCIKLPIEVFRYLENNGDAFPFICKDCTPKLTETKELLKKVSAIEKQQQEDQSRFTSLQVQINQLVESQQKQTKENKGLSETISVMKAKSMNLEEFPDLLTANQPQAKKLVEMITQHVQPALKPIITTEISERDKIEAIKHNLIISGMEDNEDQTQDEEKFIKMIEDEMDLTIEVESTERVPRKNVSESPKLLRVIFKDLRTRKSILSKATTLRNSQDDHVKENVYIRPELTFLQLEESKNLTKSLRAKRTTNPNKTFKIYRGKIIEVTTQPEETPEQD